jgi:hypothetical protein
MTRAARSTGANDASAPFGFPIPIAVRTAEMMKTSDMD